MSRGEPKVLAVARSAPRQQARTLVLRPLLPGNQRASIPALLSERALARQREESTRRVYFDTEDRALAARGLALWITGEGGDTLAILESVRASEGLIADRSEWRVPIARPTPDLAAFSDSEARAFLDGLGSERLVAIGEGQIARSELTLGWPQRNHPQALLTVVFEQGVLAFQGAQLPIARLQLQARRGADRALLELTQALRSSLAFGLEFPFAPLPLQRGARDGGPAALKAPAVVLDPKATVGQAFASIGRACLVHWLANEALVRAFGDIEAVHQLRVGLRRLRSAFSLFRAVLPEAEGIRLGGELRWLLSAVAPLRDRDVLVDEILAPLLEAEVLPRELRALAQALADQRAALLERVRAALDEPRCADLALDVFLGFELGRLWKKAREPERELLQAPIQPFAREVLRHRFRKAKKKGRNFDELDAAGRHALRIAIKKLRYGVEFFASLWPGEQPRQFARRLAKVQDLLGRLNDLAVAEHQLRALLAQTRKAERSIELALASGAVLGWHARTLSKDLARAGDLWQSLRARTPFWAD